MVTGTMSYNDAWAEIIGYNLAEIRPTTIEFWRRTTHPQDYGPAQRRGWRRISGVRPNSTKPRCGCATRQVHWVWVLDRGRVSARDTDGKPFAHVRHTSRHHRTQAGGRLLSRRAANACRRHWTPFPTCCSSSITRGRFLKLSCVARTTPRSPWRSTIYRRRIDKSPRSGRDWGMRCRIRECPRTRAQSRKHYTWRCKTTSTGSRSRVTQAGQ